MKLSTIIRAIVRPHVELRRSQGEIALLIERDFDRAGGIPYRAKWGVGLVLRTGGDWSFQTPPRAREVRIGDLTVAWWGRDTLVHPTEAS